MRIVVIGATGHVGSYLVPDLVRAGHTVVAMSRGHRQPYHADDAWNDVETVALDRDAAESDGTFVDSVLATRPDVVIDMVCFTPQSARTLVDGLAGHVERLLVCGTIWVHGIARTAPIRESDPREPFGEYGVQKAAIERIVLDAGDRLPAAVLHPGHISGPGWPVITPLGNLDPAVWCTLAAGRPLAVPMGGAAMMHHVHAADVALAFRLAATDTAAIGEAFHVVSERAVSTRGLAQAAAAWFGHTADLREVSWDEFAAGTAAGHVEASRAHLLRNHVMSIDKARTLLGYEPLRTSEDAVREAVEWLVRHDDLLTAP